MFRFRSAICDLIREIMSVLREHFYTWVTLVIFVILSPWLHPWELAGRAFVSRDSIVSWWSASFLEVGTPSISVTIHSIASLIKPSRWGDCIVPIIPLCRNKTSSAGVRKTVGEISVLILSPRDRSNTSDLCDTPFLSREFLQPPVGNLSDKYSGHEVKARIMLKLDGLFSLRRGIKTRSIKPSANSNDQRTNRRR